ncbi:MAG: serine hydrolase [Acidobacteria bacterium]|nr:serine hydrolase [Acidobacteriota bacterium]
MTATAWQLVVSLLFSGVLMAGRLDEAPFDVLVKGGTVYDGSGGPPRRADIGTRGDRIAAIGDLRGASARTVIEAKTLAVAPGFINMLSHSEVSLIQDGRSQGDIRQGVTTEIFGEGSMGPLSPSMKVYRERRMGDIRYDMPWTTLAEYLLHLEQRGISPNVGSFVSAATVREHVIGFENKKPTPPQLEEMKELVRREMEKGALGVTSALIYAPAQYASTEELIELSRVASRYQGKFIAHMRSEGDRLLEAIDEMIRVAREGGLPVEIYHLKASGRANWDKLDAAIARIEAARKAGLRVTADMYTYPAGSTGFDACMPPWALEGGYDALFERLADAGTRRRIRDEMTRPADTWENVCHAAGTPEKMLLVGFRTDGLRPLAGKTVAEVAKSRGQEWPETVMDLVREDRSRVAVVYFLMSEDNVAKQIKLPWVSFGSDAPSMAPESVFVRSSTHPRAYGNVARLLGRYVREEKLISLQEAVRRLSGLPADTLGLDRRGFLREGMFADIVVFDPATIADKATFEKPHQYSVGVRHVLVNGVPVLKDGEHTGATPGRAIWGPGRVSMTTIAPAADASLESLAREVERLSEGSGGLAGMAALHLETGRRLALRGGERFPMASTFKLPVAVELLRRVDAGEVSLDEMVTLRPRDLHPGSGTLTGLFNKPGVSLSIRNLLELMLLISDNAATDLLMERAGGAAAVTARMKALGLEGIDVSRATLGLIAGWSGVTSLPPEDDWSPALWRRLFEAVPETDRKAAAAAFEKDPRDTATPDAMVDLLAKIHKKSLHKPETAELTGTIGGTTNDVGIMTLPQGAGHVAIAVFIKSSIKPVAEREKVIAQLSRTVHDFFLFRPVS